MRIVIIGSTGLIGSHLTNAAVARGHFVVALSRRKRTTQRPDPLIQYSCWDGFSAKDLLQLIDGADVIVNLAGESIGRRRWTPERKSILRSSRLDPANAIVSAWKMAEHKPTTLIQASGIGFYGVGEDEKTEASAVGNDYLAKFAQEWESSTQEIETLGFRRVIIRSGVVLDRQRGVLPQILLPFKFFVGGPIGRGKQILSWIHIADEVEAILFLIESKDSYGIYNLTAPSSVTNAQMGRCISKASGLPYWIPVPQVALKLLLGEMSTLVLDGQNVKPTRLIAEGYKFKYKNIETALSDLFKKRK